MGNPQPDAEKLGLRVSRTSIGLLGTLAACCALVWAFANVWTVPAALVWHARNGNSVWFGGRKIVVPWDMWAEQASEQELTIVREAPNYPVLHAPSGIMLIGRNPDAPPTNMTTDFERIDRASERPTNGYVFLRVVQLDAEKGTGYCWESVTRDVALVSVACWFDRDTLDASYVGSAEYRERFYGIVAAIAGAALPPRAVEAHASVARPAEKSAGAR